jgi:hypothetical protein
MDIYKNAGNKEMQTENIIYSKNVWVILMDHSGRVVAGFPLVVRDRYRLKSRDTCVGQSGTGAGLLLLPLPLIHSTNCSTVIIIYHPGLVQQANKWPQ